MKTSIKSNLFFITYGIILLFIVGLIVLNNTYLASFYRDYREKTLLLAFQEVKNVNLTSEDLPTLMLDIENSYNISIHILKEVSTVSDVPTDVPNGEGGFNELPIPYTRIYGNQFSIRDGVISKIMQEFGSQPDGSTSSWIQTIDDYSENEYVAFTATITPDPNQVNEDFQMLGLVVSQVQPDNLTLYYILTVTFQSIQDSVSIFNSFTIIVGIFFMFISAFIVYFASYKFTNPILQITQVTQDLANLDFSKKVDIDSTDELGVLGSSINKMSMQLENSIKDLQSANIQLSKDIELKTKIDDMRKEFIASASHELKTPISLILGYSEALKLTGLDKATVDDYLNIIIDESNQMNKLVMGLLQLSQLESGFQELNISSFSLSAFVDETVRLYAIKFGEKNVVPLVEVEDVIVESDYDQIQTVLTNFLGNALHHVDELHQISIKSYTTDHKDYRLEIFNSGKHILDSDLDRIWDSFYKVDKARTRNYGGQGLGLSIVKNTLTNLGYEFGVKNIENGVVFYFVIKEHNQISQV